MNFTEPKWYIIQVVSNYEQKVKESLENRIFEDHSSEIKEVFLPTETKLTKTGKQIQKIIFPGYIFLKVLMTDESWYIIRNTQYVTGIVGSSGQGTKPTPIPETQIFKIIERIKLNSEEFNTFDLNQKKIFSVDYNTDDWVEIISGNFQGKSGKVINIDFENQVVVLELTFFGRLTPITFSLTEVQLKQ